MTEVWLQTNRRILWVALLIPLVLLAGGLGLLVLSSAWLVRCLAAMLIGGGLAVACSLVRALREPRLARDGDELLVYLRRGPPLRVPLEHVECFFFGEGPVPDVGTPGTRSANIVVRLAESARDWQEAQVNRHLGEWEEGYITIRGLWTEPIDAPLMLQLNERLRQAHRELREAEQAASS